MSSCVSQEIIRELLGITPGASPPASNASPIVTNMKVMGGKKEVWKTSPPSSGPHKRLDPDREYSPPPPPLPPPAGPPSPSLPAKATKEEPPLMVSTASFGSEKLLLRLGSSGSVPPALQPRSERARRIQNIVQCARMNSPHRPGELCL